MAKAQSTFLRKLLQFVVKTILVFVLFALIFVTYAGLKVSWAKKQVEAFSRVVVIGQPVAGLKNKAKEMHLNYRQMGAGNEQDGRFSVGEGFILNCWSCDVEYKDGKVSGKRVTFLD